MAEPKPGGITLGNALTMASMVIGVVLTWTALASDVSANTTANERQDRQIAALDARLTSLVEAIASDRLKQTAILTEMSTDLRYLRQAFEHSQAEAKSK